MLCDAILARHGDAITAVMFYGSCLRRGTDEGVLDFYVLVDGYRPAYPSRWLALVNALVPPNVFYLSTQAELGPVRCKYAVISERDFEHAISNASRHPYIWARFAQPALMVHARDPKARDFVARCVAQAIITFVRRLVVFMPAKGRSQRFSAAALWHQAFRRTYGSELRTESEQTVRENYDAAPDRYREVTALSLDHLQQEGWIESTAARGPAFEIEMQPLRRGLGRLRWHLERPVCKLLALVRLVKNATTFGDWLPYIAWKLERHTGKRLELTDRQRKYPLLFGWPVLVRLLWRRDIR